MTLTRLRRLVSSNWHALLDAAEDPVKLTDELLREMAREVDRAWGAAVHAMAQERLLADLRTRRAADAGAARDRAGRAAAQHDDAGAREALRRAHLAEAEVSDLDVTAERARTATARARAHVRRLEDALASARSRRAALVARERAAATVVAAAMIPGGSAGDRSAFGAFARLEEKIAAREAEASAWEEVAQEGDPGVRLADLDVAVEADLAALKDATGR
jgi:phage shock protein A